MPGSGSRSGASYSCRYAVWLVGGWVGSDEGASGHREGDEANRGGERAGRNERGTKQLLASKRVGGGWEAAAFTAALVPSGCLQPCRLYKCRIYLGLPADEGGKTGREAACEAAQARAAGAAAAATAGSGTCMREAAALLRHLSCLDSTTMELNRNSRSTRITESPRRNILLQGGQGGRQARRYEQLGTTAVGSGGDVHARRRQSHTQTRSQFHFAAHNVRCSLNCSAQLLHAGVCPPDEAVLVDGLGALGALARLRDLQSRTSEGISN